jgi:hypothetical protein
MGALSFKGEFVPKVEIGLTNPSHPDAKRQSIRNFRKRPLKVGEWLALYFAQRSKWCRKLGESAVANVYVIRITESFIKVYSFRWSYQINQRWDLIALDPERLEKEIRLLKLENHYKKTIDLNAFAKADGFRDFETMKRWWKITHKLKEIFYTGNLYKW